MKMLLSVVWVIVSVVAASATEGDVTSASAPEIISRDPHGQTWSYFENIRDENGNILQVEHSFQELCTGLNRFDPNLNAYVPASINLEIVNNHALINNAQFKAIFSPTLLDPAGTFDLLMPDQQTRLVLQPIGIAYTDAAGRSAFIAECTDVDGLVIGNNVVEYRNCLDDVKGTIRFQAALNGVEQWVFIQEQLPPPSFFGVDDATARLECWTQVVQGPKPQITQRQIEQGQGKIGRDQLLDFGSMHIPLGKAFNLGSSDGTWVMKEWVQTDGLTFLVESLDFQNIKEEMGVLPGRPEARLINKEKLKEVAASRKRTKPVSLAVSSKPLNNKKQITVALSDTVSVQKAYAIDYSTVSTGATNFTFKGDTTYYVTGPSTFTGSSPGTTFQSGTVIKFASTNSPKLTLNGPIVWNGAAYRPVILTGKDDASVGESISGAGTLTPANRYADIALEINASTAGADAVLQHFRICNAVNGISLVGRSGNQFSHVQFVNCNIGIQPNGTEFKLRNALFVNVLTNFKGLNSVTGRLEHITADGANWFNHNSSISPLFVTNSLLVAVSNGGNFTSNSVSSSLSPAGVFAAVGEGEHYLPPSSVYRNAGVGNVSIASELKALTTEAPVLLTGLVTAPYTLYPIVQRDTDLLDLGAHYCPIDYACTALSITNTTLTLTNGVAIGIYGAKGFTFQNGAKLISEGNPSRLNRIVRYNAVQEQPESWESAQTGFFELNSPTSPEIQLTFTDVSLLAGSSTSRTFINGFDISYNQLAPLAISHSQLRGLSQVFRSFASSSTIAFTDNVIESSALTFEQGVNFYTFQPFPLTVYNNLFREGSQTFNYKTNTSTWTVKDNLFDSGTLGNGSLYSFSADYNGYTAGLTSLGGTHNKTNLATDYLTGPLGKYYYPVSGTNLYALVNAGSRNATNATLFHFGTTIDNAKETNSVVDIGAHYPALQKVRFVGADLITKGDWKGAYGSQGYNVIQEATNYPAFATVTPSGKSDYLWANPTTDARALLKATTNRIAACWYSATTFDLALTQNDNQPHRIALYCLDWDSLGRSEKIEFKDSVTGLVYDTRTVSAFSNGQYYIWDVIGNVTIRFTTLGGVNSVLSGIFFDAGSAIPADGEGDGTADYAEDRNGNGTADTGETDWQAYDSMTGLLSTPGFEVYTPLN
jgi:hypothetical protein